MELSLDRRNLLKTRRIKKYPPMASNFYQNRHYVRILGKIHHSPPDKTSEPHFYGGPYYTISENFKGKRQHKKGKAGWKFALPEGIVNRSNNPVAPGIW
jgi:hypothetical protein